MNKADDSIRLEFFNKFLDSNPVIRSQFHQSLQTRERQQEVTLSPAERREFVHSEEVLYRREMEDLKFQYPDWEDYPPPHHGHIPCYDILEDVANETIEHLFAGFGEEILGGLNNGKVVSSLLHRAREENWEEYMRIGKTLWYKDLYKYDCAAPFFRHIDPGKEPEFFKDVVRHLANTTRTGEYYRVLKDILSEEEKGEFLEQQKMDHHFCAIILSMENRHEELLERLSRNMDIMTFTKCIPYLVESHPAESLQLIEDKIMSELEHRRGRSLYKDITTLLQSAHLIKGQEENADLLIQKLYNHKPPVTCFEG